jgi:hypothetical protein
MRTAGAESGMPANARAVQILGQSREMMLTDPEAHSDVAHKAESEYSCHEPNNGGRGAPIVGLKSFYFRGAEDLLFDGHAFIGSFPGSRRMDGCIFFNTLHTV